MSPKDGHPFKRTLDAMKDLHIQELPIPASISEIGRPAEGEVPVSVPQSFEPDQEDTKEPSDSNLSSTRKVDEQDDV